MNSSSTKNLLTEAAWAFTYASMEARSEIHAESYESLTLVRKLVWERGETVCSGRYCLRVLGLSERQAAMENNSQFLQFVPTYYTDCQGQQTTKALVLFFPCYISIH